MSHLPHCARRTESGSLESLCTQFIRKQKTRGIRYGTPNFPVWSTWNPDSADRPAPARGDPWKCSPTRGDARSEVNLG